MQVRRGGVFWQAQRLVSGFSFPSAALIHQLDHGVKLPILSKLDDSARLSRLRLNIPSRSIIMVGTARFSRSDVLVSLNQSPDR